MTFHFGAASSQRLDTCHHDIRAIMREALANSPIDFTIVCGSRTEDEQNEAFDGGFSRARFGQSPHNFEVKDHGGSPAVDAAPFANGAIQWEDDEMFNILATCIRDAARKLLDEGVVSHELVWGNDWDDDGIQVEDDPDESMVDKPHWQFKNWRELV